jgi:hypothetical protein
MGDGGRRDVDGSFGCPVGAAETNIVYGNDFEQPNVTLMATCGTLDPLGINAQYGTPEFVPFLNAMNLSAIGQRLCRVRQPQHHGVDRRLDPRQRSGREARRRRRQG